MEFMTMLHPLTKDSRNFTTLNNMLMKHLKICLLLIITCLSVNYIKAQNQKPMKNYDYEKAWKQVQDAEYQGLPETAQKVVKEIYDNAKAGNNVGQLVKAVIHRLKYTTYKEENAFTKILIDVESEAKNATFPVKPLLHSVLAEMYWNYYQQNRWRFQNRTKTVNFDNNDINTWTIDKIVEEVFRHYQLSLADADKSKETLTDIYEPVLQGGNEYGKILRPTLYEFLAYRALGFYANQEAEITKPAYAFVINDKSYLSDYHTFINLQLTTQDTLSQKFHALQLYQDILKFIIAKKEGNKKEDALVYTDLQRLQFVKEHLTLPEKEDIYLGTLEKLENEFIKFPVSTIITYNIAQVWAEKGREYKPLQGDAHKNDLRKAYDLCEVAKKRFPDSDGAIMAENFQKSLLNKSLTAKTEKINLPNQPFLALLNYQNIDKVYWRIVPITREEVKAQRKKYPNLYDYEEKERRFLLYFLSRTLLKDGKVRLPDDKDLNPHAAEIKLDGVPAGDYMVIFSHDADFSTKANGIAYTFVTVSEIAYIHRNRDDGSTDFFVLNRNTGEPVKDVKAQIYLTKYNSKTGEYEQIPAETLISDANGYLRVPYQNKKGNDYYASYFSVNFSYLKDKLSMKDIDDENYYNGSVYQHTTTNPETHRQTFLFLDRAIYRPGQTLYFKGLVVDTDGKNPKIVSNSSAKVVFYDVNHQIVAEKDVKTNEYGTFSGTFTTPSSGLTGQMYLQLEDGSGSQYFSVEEYKRPKFEVKLNPLKGAFQLNETVKSTGQATAYSGANIDGALVKYRVVRRAVFPYWWYYWRGYYPSSPEMEITHGETKTDAEGKFTIDFKAIPDESVDRTSEPTFTFTVYADVTDINGETHSAETYLSIGYKTLKININQGDMDMASLEHFSVEDGKKIAFSTTNLMGEPEQAAVTIKIRKLKSPDKTFRNRLWERPDRFAMTKEEFYKNFPYDLYDDESNAAKWETEAEVFSRNFEAGKEQNFIFYPNAPMGGKGKGPGVYCMELTAKDKTGQDVKEIVYFNVFDSRTKLLAIPQTDAYQVLVGGGEPGEKASLQLGSSEKVKILYETEQEGKILLQQWISLNNEKKTIEIPLLESYRGGIAAHYAFVKHNRFYGNTATINVPYTNKQLDIKFETFRDKLQPGQNEEWRLKISDQKADKLMAEMVATLYDASLDVFRANSWYAGFYNYSYGRLGWHAEMAQLANYRLFTYHWNDNSTKGHNYPYYRELNWFGISFYYYNYFAVSEMAAPVMSKSADMDDRASGGAVRREYKKMAKEDVSEELAYSASGVAIQKDEVNKPKDLAGKEDSKKKPETDFSDVKVRTNFNETAFFFPHLQTDENGSLVIKFTIPEALTRWKMLGFAHTKDLKSGMIQKELVTQKDLMVVPNQPRFFREGDKMTFSAKITNLSDKPLSGEAQLEFSPLTPEGGMAYSQKKELFIKSKVKVPFGDLGAKQSTNLEWQIEIPEGVMAVTYRIVAKAGNFSDGEEMVIPVVTNRMLVTETLPLPIRGNQTKTFELTKLKNLSASTNNTLKSQRFTLEFTSNPAWYAVQALPYLMEYPYECVEQTFSRFYANAIASQIANSNPKVKRVFDTWRNYQPDALLSNLEKNQELKTALLEETPWVLNAKDESQRKRNIALLFDLNRMANEQQKALEKIKKAQLSSGGFSWFPGFPEDRYMTQHIVAGLGHLDVMQVKLVRNDASTWEMTQEALGYLENQFVKDYQRLLDLAKQGKIKLDDNHLGYLEIHFLYTWSYFKKDRQMSKMLEAALGYYQGQARKYWNSYNIYMQGMLALSTSRLGDTVTPTAIIKSLNERALHSDEMGMYWKNEFGWYWYQAPVETQALLIEVYDEVANDKKAVDDMKVWLLKQKQTQDWKTTRATSEACYALLRRGTDMLASDELVQVQVGNEKVNPVQREDTRIEAGTGYFKTAWTAGQITPEMGSIKVTNPNQTVAWGAVYWQYFENLDKITPAQTPLSIKKQLFLQQNTDRGIVITPVTDKTDLKTGDLVTVRIELRVDRAMEYVHMKDMRAAGFEPVQTLSTHKYQDGLWYYESPRDLATNFFFGYLPKGTFVFEYPLRVSQKGDFSNGITTIQCMYAPEFTSHSEGVRVKMK
jgi:uncharacterized protein YfaS (alpha-2-macroglobulin family)